MITSPRCSVHSYKHLLGTHCVTAALRNLVHYYTGEVMSEAMIFGLGSGLNFTYIRRPGSNFFLTMGRGTEIETLFADLVNIDLDCVLFRERGPAWQFVQELISEQHPVMVDTDMFHLPYIIQSHNLMPDIHFGGHKILVTGYDMTLGRASVYDYAWRDEQTLDCEVLADARSTPKCPSPPANAAYLFRCPRRVEVTRQTILLSLSRTLAHMRNPASNHVGLPALDRFTRQVLNWARLGGAEQLETNLRLASFMFQRAGTGGGNYRALFARFLDESSRYVQSDSLDRAARVYRQLAILWRDLSVLLSQWADAHVTGRDSDPGLLSATLRDIWSAEVLGLELIEDVVHSSATTQAQPTMKEFLCQ